MSNLQIFKNNEFGEIRTIVINNDPYLMLNDVCRVLELNNVSQVKTRLNKDGVITNEVMDSLGRKQQATFINEPNFYKVVFQSRKPQAEAFTEYVANEVLPSIRKHGAYLTDEKIEEVLMDPDTIIKLATQLKEEREQRKALEQLVEEDKPKVLFAEAVESSDDVILVKEMATILTQRGFDIGQNQLFQYLRDNEYLCKKAGDMYHLPTRKYEHLFKVTKRIVQNSKGSAVKNTPKITGKGQLYFIKKFDEYLEQGLTIKDLLERKSA